MRFAFRGSMTSVLIAGSAALMLSACSQKTDTQDKVAPAGEAGQPSDSPARPAANPLRNAYFGDLHIHTANSYDAYIFNVRRTPDDAYVFAKGGVIRHPMGHDLQLKNGPLDFLAVTDHAEYLGVLEELNTPGTEYSELPIAEGLFSPEPADVIAAFVPFGNSLGGGEVMPELSDPAVPRSAWQQIIDAAEKHYEPGNFTTFVGYEFTSHPAYRNLHRNVIFEDEPTDMPYTALDSQNPEDLWRWMDARREEGIDSLAIPHNSNASNGTMFEMVMWDGEPIDAAYADLRVRNEPLVEITQIKGTSETTPMLSPNDEWAGFQLMTSHIGALKPITKFEGGYVRDALKRGLVLDDETGGNPYKVGFAGASDGHTGGGPFEEDNYFAKVGVLDGIPQRRGSVLPDGVASWEEYYQNRESTPLSSTWGSAGLTGVWAEENTREALFAAMRRKETFATTGPRMQVRMFAGQDLQDINLGTEDGVREAYARATPMGGDIVMNTESAPEFVVMAMRDAHSAPLQRIQIVKGWTDASGAPQEKLFDIACSDDGTVDPDTQRCPNNGAGVNLETCEYDEDKGAAQIHAHWADPEFDPRQNAFYYARVLENPSCRWSTWDALRAGAEPNPRLPKTIQERAFTSPVWYKPVSRESSSR